jgi:asparagine synthase (glutamine-hydrolysing)
VSAIGAIFEIGGPDPAALKVMLESLARFPHDAKGAWSAGPLGLAACMRWTDATSRACKVPFTSEDGTVAAVFDGYFLNSEELIRDLEATGERINTKSDVEIALVAYRVWGEDCANRFEGEFALIIADQGKGRLFLAGDHMGFFPLYYRQEGARLIVASDFRTIARLSSTPLTPNHVFLAQVMTHHWYLREDTPWREVKRLTRAHTLSFSGKEPESRRYWVPPTNVTIRYKREEDYVEHYREILFDCIRRASRSDRDVAIAVSGGLDSSAIFSVAQLLEQDGKWPAPGLRAYTLAAREGENAYELPYARAAVEFHDRELTEIPLFDPDIDWYTNDARWHHDIAIPSNGAMMLEMESRMVADGCRVVLNGTGGDEWLQGPSHYFAEHLRAGDIATFLRTIAEESDVLGPTGALRKAFRETVAEYTPRLVRRQLRRLKRARQRREDRGLNWLTPELQKALGEAQERFEADLPENPLAWGKIHTATTPFGDLSHQMMARLRSKIGLQSRHPMLARAFMEFSLSTPANIKRRGERTKIVHRQALKGLMAPEVLERSTKANFTNTKIDQQFADYVRRNAGTHLKAVCNLTKLETILNVDFATPEGDYWAWEIWGLYATAAFLYEECDFATGYPRP